MKYPECKVAIIIQQGNKDERFLDRLFGKFGEERKTIETRKLSVWKRILKIMGDDYKGQAILFINNKNIVGYGILSDVKIYKDEEAFNSDFNKHFVTNSSEYKWDENNPKVGLIFNEKPVELKNPISLEEKMKKSDTHMQGYYGLNPDDYILKINLKN